ncbi:hypothetical protein [Oceanobacillus bengalensis]|uniref:Uncharacterized protein n=1 Tax=Oceanobacillus bengalensis TaxID=1435466 RepID=A0A494YR98_9BACI|nr:hypothetical protein [Oceanobacillus bengalensis]RKQ11772.1 hypothetical protein D8M05_19350 [Oceanobacillus bengalensis]
MEYELSLKNKRVGVWLWIMVPAFILTFVLFAYLPNEIGIVPVLPLIIGYFTYLCWAFLEKRKQK